VNFAKADVLFNKMGSVVICPLSMRARWNWKSEDEHGDHEDGGRGGENHDDHDGDDRVEEAVHRIP
jgi:hypothetical protein